jgi:hypothetical protein
MAGTEGFTPLKKVEFSGLPPREEDNPHPITPGSTPSIPFGNDDDSDSWENRKPPGVDKEGDPFIPVKSKAQQHQETNEVKSR